ncbi:hypothetical protein A9Q99_20500 [Gammaproteobacteria bacterium 45_16_T64]|nr:hypothetical protein A9Q99_20500 [Gammaproteobacteria bacterium 45_16_T64]
MIALRVTTVLYLLLSLWGCTGSESEYENTRIPDAALPTQEQCDRYAEFPFDLESSALVVPYPNNIFTELNSASSTGVNLVVDKEFPLFNVYFGLLSYWLKSFETLEGFGLYSDLFIPLPDVDLTLNTEQFTDSGSGVFLMVIDPDHRFFGEIAPVYASLGKNYLRLTPKVPLLENTDYALVVTNDWQKQIGLCLEASPSMRRLINGESSISMLAQHEGLLVYLEQNNIERESLLSLSRFTTMPIFSDMEQAIDILDNLNNTAPAILTDWEFEPSESPLTESFVHAKLETPMFSDLWGIWRNNAGKTLTVERSESVDVLFSLPNREILEHEQPYPLMLYVHGTSKSRHDVKEVSDWFAKAGIATIGMDSLCHGDRANFIGNESLCYYNFLNPLSWRDNGRETVVGLLWLLKAIENMSDVDVIPEGGDGIPDFDVNQIYVMGVSLGAIQSGVLAGLVSNIDGYVFNVAGAKFTDIAFDHSVVRSILGFAGGIDSIVSDADLTHLVYLAGMVFQSTLDASDPGVFLYNARRLRGKTYNVLQQGAAFDNQVSGLSGASFARAGGWPQLSPYVWEADIPIVEAPHWGSGFVQYDTADHDMIWRDDDLAFDLQSQLHYFLSSLRESGEGEIVITH